MRDVDVGALERQNRVLERRLQRLTDTLARVEDQKEATSRLMLSTIEQMQAKEDELVATNAALRAATSAKSIFLANMSHELRTPLNAVIGYAELLLDEPAVASAASEELDAIVRASRGLLALIDGILDLTKIETGHFELEARSFPLADVIRDVVLTIGPLARARGLRFGTDVRASPDAVVRGDEVRLRQVVVNLLSNAVKFTAGGEVSLGVSQHGPTLLLSVQDTGIGMTADELSRVFDPFVQGDSSTTRRFGGTGLGLSIARKLVERMGGSIDVTSSPGQGTRFALRFPDLLQSRHDTTAAGPGGAEAG